MRKLDAVVIQSRGKTEVRCAKCGKLLFICKNFSKKSEKPLDESSQNVIIVARCPRSDCKADNQLVILPTPP